MSFFKNHTRRLGRRNAALKATGGGKTLSGELEKIIETSDPFNKKVSFVSLNNLEIYLMYGFSESIRSSCLTWSFIRDM